MHCDNPAAGEYIHDATLLQVIGSKTSPSNTGQSLLDAIDTSNLPQTVEDSGKIAFIFEKISKSDMDQPPPDE